MPKSGSRKYFGFRRRARRMGGASWQCINIAGSLAVAASATISTSKAFTYAQVFQPVMPSSQLPLRIRKVAIELQTVVSTNSAGAASVFAELVGIPWTAATGGAAAEGACATPVRVVGMGGRTTLVLKPTLAGNSNWIDPTSVNQFFSMSALSLQGATLQYAIRIYYTVGRQSGYHVV